MTASLPITSSNPATLPRSAVTAPSLEALTDVWPSTEPWIAYGRMVLIGLAVVTVLFAFVSISGAVVASGTVTVESNTKTVQHLDGGIVQRILV